MVKKKKGDLITHQSDSATTSSYSGDDDTYDYIVFEADTSTTVSDPCWSDSEYDSEDITSSNLPTLVNNIRQAVHTVHEPSRHVRFSDEIVTHVIEIEDRKGYWTEDRSRFQQRCTSVMDAISFIFDEVHRRKMRLIVNLSGRVRAAIVPYSGGMYEDLKHTDRSLPCERAKLAGKIRAHAWPATTKSLNPTTISSYSNISRDHFMPTIWWSS